MDGDGIGKSSGRAKSCVVCRQYKLRCDARKTAPNPCSRCVSKQLKCRFDPNFRRIPTRKIVQEIADGIHTLRAKSAETGTDSQPAETNTSLSTNGNSTAGLLPKSFLETEDFVTTLSSSNSQPPQAWLDFNYDEELTSQRLGSIELDAQQILYLFQSFERDRLPHARFLRPLKSISGLIKTSQLLFWTIILVTLDTYDGSNTYETIAEPHEELLAKIVHTSIQQIEVIHALLLLCLWPVPKLRNYYEPSWNYVGLATNAAMTLNCHEPLGDRHMTADWKGTSDTRASELGVENQAMTWLACFEIGSWQSSFLGFAPPMASSQHSRFVRQAIHNAAASLPPQTRVRVEILQLRDTAVSQLDFIENTASHFAITTTFVAQLEALKACNNEIWDNTLELTLQSAMIYVCGMTLVKPIKENEASQASVNERIALFKCFDAAKIYISIMARVTSMQVEEKHAMTGRLRALPKHFYSNTFLALNYIWRTLVLKNCATKDQKSAAVQTMIEGHGIFQSHVEHRDAIRAAIQLELLMEIYETSSADHMLPIDELVTSHRFAASVMLDASFRLTHYRNRNPIDGSPTPVPQWKSQNIKDADRLPLAPEQKRDNFMTAYSDEAQDVVTMVDAQGGSTQTWANYMHDFAMMNEPFAMVDAELGATQPLDPQAFADLNIAFSSQQYRT